MLTSLSSRSFARASIEADPFVSPKSYFYFLGLFLTIAWRALSLQARGRVGSTLRDLVRVMPDIVKGGSALHPLRQTMSMMSADGADDVRSRFV